MHEGPVCGRVVEMGTHAELLARGGQYAALHALQFPGESSETMRDMTAWVEGNNAPLEREE